MWEEERVARQALERHGVGEDRLLAAASWLGLAAQARKRTGHAAASAAYAGLMRDAIELMICLGHKRRDVTARMRDGDNLCREFFPDFQEKFTRDLRYYLRGLAKEFRQYPDTRFDDFDDACVEEFITWLEARGLLAAHMAVPAIMREGHRPDRSADVGVALQVTALAAWLEHVAGELTSSESPSSKPLGKSNRSTLSDKLKNCWAGHAAAAELNADWDSRWVSEGTPFAEAIRQFLNKPVNNRVGWMVRDALFARQIRNESLHRGLKCTRQEMRDAMCILLRTAMGVWLVGR